ncbi:MAG: hypothetical protein FWE98_00190 [Oscillospiraceae bacterium]|nr:hypothetical protein [Oscillospiraceae bacterium]
MRKLFAVLLILGVLGLGGCGVGEVPTTEPSTAPTTEQATEEQLTTEEVTTTKVYPPPVPPEVVNTEYVFTTSWAKTPTHFYATSFTSVDDDLKWVMLRRVPLSDISKPEELSLPKEYRGHKLERIDVCGITEQWLFIDCRYEKWEGDRIEDYTWSDIHALFRISLETLEAEVIRDDDDYHGNTWYNAGSNSLIFYYSYDENFEALRLDTGERIVIERPALYGGFWHNTTDGLIVRGLEGGDGYDDAAEVIVIDSKNNATVMPFKELKLIPRPWERESEIKVPLNDKVKKMLDWDDDQGNSTSGLQSMDDMILVLVWGIYGNYDGYFHALYDPATGAVFQ